MDNGTGSFVEIGENKAKAINSAMGRELSGIFQVGETLEIRGSKFRVERIKTRSLRLLLLPSGVDL